MIKEEHIPWQWLLLGILENSHGHQATLQDIYIRIEEDYHDFKKDGTELIKPKLLDKDFRWGDRPKYQHTVRGCLSKYEKLGWVNRTDRATYRLTDEGLKRLRWLQENV
jgi:peptide deformylase